MEKKMKQNKKLQTSLSALTHFCSSSAFSMWTLVLSEAGLVSALHAGSPCTVDTAAPGKERARCSEDASARCTPNLPGLVRWAGTQKVLRGTEPNSCVSGGQLGTAVSVTTWCLPLSL